MGYFEDRQLWNITGKPKKEKKVYTIPKKSAKKIAQEKEENNSRGDGGLDAFFELARKSMTGKCLFCGGKTEKKNDDTYRRSIAHLLPKRKNQFPSISTNQDNWIELCFYGNSCHTNFDNGMITWEFLKDSKEWDIIKEKLFQLLPLCTIEERKNKLYEQLTKLIYQ